jgi:predicted PurR-regulated permease PerM
MPGSSTQPSSPPAARDEVTYPAGLRRVAGWSWRLLVILGAAAAVLVLVARLEVLFVALFVAMLLTSLLAPAAGWLRGRGVPPLLASAAVLLGALIGLGTVVFLVVFAVIDQTDELSAAVTDGLGQVQRWVEQTFGLSLDQIESSVGDLIGGLGEGGGSLVGSAFGAASTAFEVLAGLGIAIFATIFFVHDGDRIWGWARSLFPVASRQRVDEAGRLSWQSLSSYARATVLIAAIDGLGIGLGAALLGVPLALPIGVLVFFGSFIPIVGALITGLVAVLIALATLGVTSALLMAVVVIGVQQLEGHVLQPLIQGRLVAIHPLAVVLAVAAGSTIAGIVGAVIAVPIVAVCNVLVRYIASVSRGEDAPTVAVAVAATPPADS